MRFYWQKKEEKCEPSTLKASEKFSTNQLYTLDVCRLLKPTEKKNCIHSQQRIPNDNIDIDVQ